MARVFCKTDGGVIELSATDEILFSYAGIPGRGLTVGQLVSAVGDDQIYAELMGRAILATDKP